MSPRLFAMVFIPFSFLQVIFGLVAGSVEGVQATGASNLFLSMREISEGSILGFPVRFITAGPGFIQALWEMIIWDYPFFYGDWNYFRVLILFPLSGTLAFGFLITLVRALFRV